MSHHRLILGSSIEKRACNFDQFCDDFYSFDSSLCLCDVMVKKYPQICFYIARAARGAKFSTFRTKCHVMSR